MIAITIKGGDLKDCQMFGITFVCLRKHGFSHKTKANSSTYILVFIM
jgi:hypothetical protein